MYFKRYLPAFYLLMTFCSQWNNAAPSERASYDWLKPPRTLDAYSGTSKNNKKRIFPGGQWLKTCDAYHDANRIIAFCKLGSVSRYCNSFIVSDFKGLDQKKNEIFVTNLANKNGYLIPEKSKDIQELKDMDRVVGYVGSFEGFDRYGTWQGTFKNHYGFLTIKR